MDYSINVFGLILVLGTIALIVVAVMYFYQKKKVSRSVNPYILNFPRHCWDLQDRYYKHSHQYFTMAGAVMNWEDCIPNMGLLYPGHSH